MYTILRLELNDIITYLMILTNKICSTYDYLTYDTTKGLFVDECFTYDSFIAPENSEENIRIMIGKIGKMIQEVGLDNLMYGKIGEYEDMYIEVIHVPECYQFKCDNGLNIS